MTRILGALRSKLILSAVGVGLVLVLCIAYIISGVLDRPLLERPDKVTVELTGAGGLFEGSSVTYRGVKAGRISEIRLSSTGVEAVAELTSGLDIPSNSRAVVRSLSPVGEQYLDFQPDSEEGPYLDDGDVVEASSTDIPRSLASTVIAVNDVLRQIDDTKLRSLLVELSTALDGSGKDLGQLVDDGRLLLEELDGVWPETEALLEDAAPVLDIAVDQGDDLRSLAGNAREFASFLRSYDPELDRFLQRAPGQISELQSLVDDVREVLPDFLSTGVSVTDIFALHDPHVRALLQSYELGLGTLARHVKDGHIQLSLILDKDPRCSYRDVRRDPRVAKKFPFYSEGHCPASFSTLQRGAAHAPGPVTR
ncbi:MlaD family protein [Nocardioides sp. R-C-SC26]|uniref:MlaD family protein n=1 Tax=Nocardioides sp. R-C-SC26 TaxID=2870414 RepID=UPI001E58FE8D|nr:MlaD family protein [Nocardioides sp. R-C-SC26]